MSREKDEDFLALQRSAMSEALENATHTNV